jgi:ABC-type amino acid transport substrate-binding protein
MKKFIVFLAAALFAVPAFAQGSRWQNVLNTHTLRCGYVTYEPGLVKDVNDNTLSGYDKDIFDHIGKSLDVKIEWIPAGGWGTVVEDLKTGKFDLLCNSYWTNAQTAKQVLYTRAHMYQPAFFIARMDDKRFDGEKPVINDPSVSIAVIENDSPYYMVKEKYPKAKINALPHSFDFSLIANEVAAKKSDLTVIDAVNAGKFMEQNPGKVRLIMVDNPLQIVPTAFVLPTGEIQMKQALDQALDETILSGALKTIFERYNKYPHSFYYPRIMIDTKTP